MSITKITYENKEAIQNDASVPNKSKVTDTDMNEIKQVVNNNADEVTAMQENIEDLQGGQGTADADITSLKNRVTTLEKDNTQNKSDITTLKADNKTNKSDIATLQEQFSNFENYDDTDIKKDLEDIKQEQEEQNTNISNLQKDNTKQDELITKLQEENNKLKSALINAETEESKSIHVEDASQIGSLKIFGNCEQETRIGNNLYNIEQCNATTKDADGWITLEADNSTGQEKKYVNAVHTLSKDLKVNTTYYIFMEIKEVSGNGNLFIAQFLDESKSQILTAVSSIFSDLSAGIKKYEVSTVENFEDINYMLRTFASFEAGQTGKIVFRLSLLEENIDVDSFKYEKYGASPSPNYPSEIKCLGSNKNELDIDNCTLEEGSINTDGTFTNSSNRIRVYNINLKSNKTYTISTSNKNLNVVPYFYNEEGEFISYSNGWKEFPYTFTMPNNAKILKLLLRSSLDDNIEENDVLNACIKIEEGTEATSYSPFRTR